MSFTARHALRSAAALAAVGAIAGTGTTSASAAQPSAQQPSQADAAVCLQYGAWATGCFEKTGDHVYVWDNRADGLRAEVTWETSYGRYGTCAIRAGEDDRHCNYNLAEGRRIVFVLSMIDADTGDYVWSRQKETGT
jgi:hypothetical protein